MSVTSCWLFDYLTIPYEKEKGWTLYFTDQRDMDTVMRGTKANEKQLAISGSSDTVNAILTLTAPSMTCFPPDNARLLGGNKDRDALVELQVRSRLLFKVNVILLLLVAWQVWHKCKKKKHDGAFFPSLSSIVSLLSSSPDSPDVGKGKQRSKIDRRLLHQDKTTVAAPATTTTATVSKIMLIMMHVASRLMLFISIAYWTWLNLCLFLKQQVNHQMEHNRVYDQNS